MCGRFNVIDNPGLQQLLRDLGVDLKLPPGINVAPTEAVFLVRNQQGQASAEAARWWLTPSWASQVDQKYAMFNARSETLASSRAFRQPFKRQRGIVPISSFIEWRTEDGAKQPYLISNKDRALAVAALWDVWSGGDEPLLTCTLVTTAAAPGFEPWHRRMPVMLAADEYARWLDNEHPVSADDPLFANELKFDLLVSPLSRAISNARNKEPAAMRPVGEAVTVAA
jgi:putative SOS response-associated peptidase YedK